MSGGGGRWSADDVKKIRRKLQASERQISDATFSVAVSEFLDTLLFKYNNRDVNAANERINEVVHKLEGVIDGEFDIRNGGSVAKHTYVDGLSDIDALLIVNDSELEDRKPQTVIGKIAAVLERQLGDTATVEQGAMSVKVSYADGMELQFVPALKTDSGVHVPDWNINRWSEIQPEKFTRKLSEINAQCSNKLVPLIKLVKGINSNLPEPLRLSGYHIEALGVEAFKNYRGNCVLREMLPEFFSRAKENIRAPLRDRTGQSLHVDDDLGPRDSEARKSIAAIFDRIERKIRGANASDDIGEWKSLFSD